MRAVVALAVIVGCSQVVGCGSSEAVGSVGSYRVTVLADGDGDGTITSGSDGTFHVDLDYRSGRMNGVGTGSVEQGSELTLAAQPSGASELAGWYGDDCSGTDDCTVTVDRAKAILGVFQRGSPPEEPFTLRLVSPGSFYGEGTVTSQQGLLPAISCSFRADGTAEGTCQGTYSARTEVTLRVTPASGNTFRRWLTPGCSTAATCHVTLTRSLRTVYVLFEPTSLPGDSQR